MSYGKRILGVAPVVFMALVLGLTCSKKEKEKPLPEKMSITLDGGVKMDFVLIKPGTFMMGSEKGDEEEKAEERPVHQVTITKPFYMGIYEVTQAQWKAVMRINPSYFKGDDLPVEQVSWEDCQRFLAKLKEKLGEGMIFRLPTEAEWEYACRAGSKTEYFFGDAPSTLDEYAWYDGNSEGTTHPVGQKKPNSWGLYDMYGNVAEWCADWKGSYSAGAAADPKGPSLGAVRLIRGGSWNDHSGASRSSIRPAFGPAVPSCLDGFRVVCAQAVGR